MPLSEPLRELLLDVALQSIREGLARGRPLAVDPAVFDSELRARRACFVTLNKHGNLRGCIGHLEAIQELVRDVADNAFAAAFRDPRFPRLEASELDSLDIHLSILTPAEPMQFSSEQDLLSQIRPGVDGLILEDGFHRGTFLPSVWESLPERDQFWRHLKGKAGLPASHWSENLKVYRYTTESFGAEVSAIG